MCHPANNRCYSTGYALVGPVDMSMVAAPSDGAVPDLAGTPTPMDMVMVATGCSTMVPRVCTDAMHSATCVLSGGTWQAVLDRTCPMGSTCSGGHCQPPTGAPQCTHNGDCVTSNNQVCDEYVVGSSLVGYCSAPSSTASGNMKCTVAGYDSQY